MPPSLPESPPPGLALFDLDGTLIPWDCQLLFRHFVLRREPWRGMFLPIFLAFLPLAPVLGTDGMKRVFLSYLWRISPATLAEYSRDFAAALLPAIYPEVRKFLENHRAAGHITILTSASPEFYVREIGRELGFDLALGTEVAPGPLFPDLENHKGTAKVRRLRQLLPAAWLADRSKIHGYTDSSADLPLLTLCGEATLVNPSPTLAARGKDQGWHIVRPPRPWKSQLDHALRTLALLTGLGHDPGAIQGPPACRREHIK